MTIVEKLSREMNNYTSIYLYNDSPCVWRSYSKSAIYLNQLYPNIDVFHRFYENIGKNIEIMTIDQLTFNQLISRLTSYNVYELYIEIELADPAIPLNLIKGRLKDLFIHNTAK